MDELISSIYSDPGDWSISEHVFTHSSGFKLWIANGLGCCRPYESGMYMGFLQKFRIWKAYKWWCRNAPLTQVK